MSRIYIQAMFPNGEADIMRDQYVHCTSFIMLATSIAESVM